MSTLKYIHDATDQYRTQLKANSPLTIIKLLFFKNGIFTIGVFV